jgi:hypothetical protein
VVGDVGVHVIAGPRCERPNKSREYCRQTRRTKPRLTSHGNCSTTLRRGQWSRRYQIATIHGLESEAAWLPDASFRCGDNSVFGQQQFWNPATCVDDHLLIDRHHRWRVR